MKLNYRCMHCGFMVELLIDDEPKFEGFLAFCDECRKVRDFKMFEKKFRYFQNSCVAKIGTRAQIRSIG